VKVLIVDNYDSFVGNLYQYVGELGGDPEIRRNDAVSPETVEKGGFTHLLVSPGPGRPRDAGASVELVRRFAGVLPILGVCLGHQAIGVAFGGRVVPAKTLVHGKTSRIHHDGTGCLSGIHTPFIATRYHSLALDRASLPQELIVTAWTEDGEIMGLRHRDFGTTPVTGVQFHPESVLSEAGRDLLSNFLRGGGS
jgi:anthranilate synthase/aminodeoxychorismate synthase-like glutamine amidotransferase